MFYSKQELQNCLFFDIETKPQDNLSDKMMEIWKEKMHFKYQAKELELQSKLLSLKHNSPEKYELNEGESSFGFDDIFIKYAPLQAEFSEAFCISLGMFNEDMEKDVDCICEDTEGKTLEKFKSFLKDNNIILAGYNIKGFDVPYLIKRFIINGIKLPNILQLRGKKPWDIKMLDVCEDWKGLGWESSSLDLVCTTLNLPSPKEVLKNYEIWEKFYKKEITKEQICNYCNGDVHAVMDASLKLMF